MSLLRVTPDVLEALRRLAVPFELVPAAATSDAPQLVRVSHEQRDVLLSWGVPLEEVSLEEPSSDGIAHGEALVEAPEPRRRGDRPDSRLDVEQAIIRDALKQATSGSD